MNMITFVHFIYISWVCGKFSDRQKDRQFVEVLLHLKNHHHVLYRMTVPSMTPPSPKKGNKEEEEENVYNIPVIDCESSKC